MIENERMEKVMFSQNGWISEKQVRRTLVLPVFVSSIFILPYMAAVLFGGNIVWGMGIFLVLAVMYSGILYVIGKYTVPSDKEDGTQNFRGNRWIAGIHVLRYSVRLAFYILLAVTILGEAQVPFMKEGGASRISNLLVVIPLLLVAFYGADHSMEKVARIHEMIFWVTFVPFIVMLAFGFREISWDVWVPEGEMPVWKMLLYGYLLLVCVLPAENYLQLKKVYNKKDSTVVSYGGLVAMLVLICVLSMIIVGIYGVHGAAGEGMVTISIMRYIRMPFGVLERFDMLMIWFFMTGCFVLICNTLFFAGNRYREAFGGKGVCWVMLGAMAFALLVAYRFPKYDVSILWFVWYGACVDLPLSVILPLVDHWLGRRRNTPGGNGKTRKRRSENAMRDGERSRKKRLREGRQRRKEERQGLCLTEKLCMWIFAGCFCCVVLTGCGSDMRNVEQRDYATMLVMSKGEKLPYHIYLGVAKEHRVGEQSQVEAVYDFEVENLEGLGDAYARQRGKDLSLMHVKIVLWDMDAFTGVDDMAAVLYEMDKNEEIAKTCPVLLLQETKNWIAYVEQAKTPVGTYVSNLVQTFDTKEKRVPWLKDYLKYIREGDPLVPCMLIEGKQGYQIQLAKTRYHFPDIE